MLINSFSNQKDEREGEVLDFINNLPEEYRLFLDFAGEKQEFSVQVIDMIKDITGNLLTEYIFEHPEILDSEQNEIRNILADLYIYFAKLDKGVLGEYSEITPKKFIAMDLDQHIESANNIEEFINLLDRSWRHEVRHLFQYNFDRDTGLRTDKICNTILRTSPILLAGILGLTFSGHLNEYLGILLYSIVGIDLIYTLLHKKYYTPFEKEAYSISSKPRPITQTPFKLNKIEES